MTPLIFTIIWLGLGFLGLLSVCIVDYYDGGVEFTPKGIVIGIITIAAGLITALLLIVYVLDVHGNSILFTIKRNAKK